MSSKKLTNKEYLSWVKEIKQKIQAVQIKAAITVNQEMLNLYWDLGQSISEKVKKKNWGTSVVENLSKDLKKELPNQKGFSRTNLFSMKKWYEFYIESGIAPTKVQQLVGQIPWGHNVVIVSKSKSIEEALFYAKKSIENNWSRAVLTHQMELKLYERRGKAINNFKETLPEPHSDLAIETLKDPYDHPIFEYPSPLGRG